MHYDDPKVSEQSLMCQAETLVSLGEELSKEPEIQAQMKIKPQLPTQAQNLLQTLGASLGVQVTEEMKQIALTDTEKASDLLVNAAMSKGLSEQ